MFSEIFLPTMFKVMGVCSGIMISGIVLIILANILDKLLKTKKK